MVSYHRDMGELNRQAQEVAHNNTNPRCTWGDYRFAAYIQSCQRKRELGRSWDSRRFYRDIHSMADSCIIGGPALLPANAIGYSSAWPNYYESCCVTDRG